MWNKLRELTLQELRIGVEHYDGSAMSAEIIKSCAYTKDAEFGAGGIIKAAEYECDCWDEEQQATRKTRVYAFYAYDEDERGEVLCATHCAEDWAL